MKKIITVALIFIVLIGCFSIVACNKENEDNVYGIYVSIPPTKVSYYVGEDFDVSGCVITVRTKDRKDYNVNVTPTMVSGFSSKAIGKHTLTITYTINSKSFQTTQVIEVTTKKAVSAEMINPPTNTVFVEGQDINLKGFKANVTFSDKSVEERPYEAFKRSKTEAVLGMTQVELRLDNAVIVVDIQVIPKVTAGLKVKKQPNKTVYEEGELFDPEGMEIYTVYNDGTEQFAVLFDVVDALTPLTATQNSIKVTSNDLPDFVLEVPVTVLAKSIEKIELIPETVRTLYIQGSAPDFSEIEGYVTFSDKTMKVGYDSLLFSISQDEPLDEGEIEVVVKYKYASNSSDVCTSFVLIVSKEKLPYKITIEYTDDFCADYRNEEQISILGLTIYVYYNDGSDPVWAVRNAELNPELQGFSYTQTANCDNPYIEFRCGDVVEKVAINVQPDLPDEVDLPEDELELE